MSTKRNPRRETSNHLAEWLDHPGAEVVFGASFRLKLAVMQCVVSRQGTLAEIARRHGITRQAASKHAMMIRAAYGISPMRRQPSG